MSPHKKKSQRNIILFPLLFAFLVYLLGFLYVSNEVEDSNHSDDLSDKHFIYFLWAGGSYETDLVLWTYELEYDDREDLWELQGLELNRVYHYILLFAFAILNAALTKRMESGILFGIFLAIFILISGFIALEDIEGDFADYDILTTETLLYVIAIPIISGFTLSFVFQKK